MNALSQGALRENSWSSTCMILNFNWNASNDHLTSYRSLLFDMRSLKHYVSSKFSIIPPLEALVSRYWELRMRPPAAGAAIIRGKVHQS